MAPPAAKGKRKQEKKAKKKAKASKAAKAERREAREADGSVRAAPRSRTDPGANPKAFTIQSRGRAKVQRARTAEREQRRLHVPLVGREEAGAEPPFVVVVHGPPGVGKSSVIRSLVKHFTKQNVADVQGPVTVVSGKQRRLTFVECPQDLNAMVDTAKVADLVLLVIDGSFGFEMETFEYLNMLQVHGFPKVIGVLTHLDTFTKVAQLRKAKKRLKARFWAEIYDGAKLFYFSGLVHGKYPKREVLNLSRFISVQKVRAVSRPCGGSSWRRPAPAAAAPPRRPARGRRPRRTSG